LGISTGDILGHSQVGVYLSVIGDVLFLPRSLDSVAVEEIESAFGIETHPLMIGGSSLIGSLLKGNSKGIAVADIATEEDLDELTSFGDVVVMQSGVNAAGNLVECNEIGAVVSPVVPPGPNGVEMIGEVLGVKAVRSKVAGHDTVGSMLVANSNGALAHPDITTDEAKLIEDTLGVQVMVGTVSFGSPFVGAGCAASDAHAMVGTGSTGPELNRIEDALGLI
jgi:translation initiation factor 6